MEAKKPKLSAKHHILPPEIVEKIISFLSHEEIAQTKLICKRWNEIVVKGSLLKKSYEKMFTIIIIGGFDHNAYCSEAEVLINAKSIQIPNLPIEIKDATLTIHNEIPLLIGGKDNDNNCLALRNGTWMLHSKTKMIRRDHSAVLTKFATFIFGGSTSRKTFEYLPTNSEKWILGTVGNRLID